MNHAEIDRLITRHRDLSVCRTDIESAAVLLRDALNGGGMLLACGAGAAASLAEHVVTTLMTAVSRARPVTDAMRRELEDRYGSPGADLAAGLQAALPAIALSSNSSLVGAVAADMVLAQQVYGYGRKGDALVALCPEGATESVLNALRVARALGVATVCLAPRDTDALTDHSDCVIRVPRVTATEVTELHLPVWHALCVTLEQEFFI